MFSEMIRPIRNWFAIRVHFWTSHSLQPPMNTSIPLTFRRPSDTSATYRHPAEPLTETVSVGEPRRGRPCTVVGRHKRQEPVSEPAVAVYEDTDGGH